MCRRHLISEISKLDGTQTCSVRDLQGIQLQNGVSKSVIVCCTEIFFCGMYKRVNWMMFAEWDNTHNAVLGLALGHETEE